MVEFKSYKRIITSEQIINNKILIQKNFELKNKTTFIVSFIDEVNKLSVWYLCKFIPPATVGSQNVLRFEISFIKRVSTYTQSPKELKVTK